MEIVADKKKVEFLTQVWPEIVSITSETFRLIIDEKEKLVENKTAMLIGSIPFIAGCIEPMRTALAHVAVYHIARDAGKRVFEHNPGDNSEIMSRLHEISHFQGGNEAIIMKGMDLLALQMIHGYERDFEKDVLLDKYNPVAEEAWPNHEKMKEELRTSIQACDCPEMDEIMDADVGVLGFWNNG